MQNLTWRSSLSLSLNGELSKIRMSGPPDVKDASERLIPVAAKQAVGLVLEDSPSVIQRFISRFYSAFREGRRSVEKSSADTKNPNFFYQAMTVSLGARFMPDLMPCSFTHNS